MTKTEYIAKYGEEAYEYRLKRYRERYSRKTASRTDCEFIKYLPAPEIDAKDRFELFKLRADANEKTASLLQRRIRSIWKTQSADECLIVVDYGQVRKNKVPFTFQLTDLKLTKEKEEKFKNAVEEVANNISN